MNGNARFSPSSKPLPPPGAHDKLPPPPPRESGEDWAPPPIPDKGDGSTRSPRLKMSRSQADLSQSPNEEPATPSTPGKAAQYLTVPPSPGGKKTNPLTDLIETEKEYVDRLAGIIRKVAGAWSRSNLPPPDLDTMFRSIESIYKANRSLLSKLKDIGANPSSPKALGDLLMRWIDDLEKPYTAYCTKYLCGFDSWEPVQNNDRLRTVLAMFSATSPPPLPPSSSPHPSEPPLWTLDQLFLLPKERLNYYRKLYSRLLKGTSPGRSDHRLLTSAMEKLEKLLNALDGRMSVDVASVSTYTSPPSPAEAEDEVFIDMRGRKSLVPHASPLVTTDAPPLPTSASAARPEPASTIATSQTSPHSTLLTVAALERRLSSERTLDIFTMQPRQIRLQLSPPSLHYTREVRFSADVLVRFTPRSTGTEVVHELGHVFILTDLFVLCERMKPRDRAQFGPDGPDMWLIYPPLAGKHLRVSPSGDSDTALSVTILRKETLTLHTSTPALRDRLYSEFAECIDAAAILSSTKSPPPSGQPALPSNGSQSPSGPQSPSRPPSGSQVPSRPPSAGMSSERHSGSMSPSSVRTPHSGQVQLPGGSPPVRSSSSSADAPPMENIARLTLGDPPAQRPSEQQQPAPAYPARSTSISSHRSNDGPAPGQLSRQPSFNVGQVVPSQQYGGAPPPMPSFRPGQVIHQQGPPMHPGPQGPGGPPQGFGPGQVMPSMGGRPPPGGLLQSPYGPGRGMPPPGGPLFQPAQPTPSGPGRGIPPDPQGPIEPMGPQRGPSLRSFSNDPPHRNQAPMGMPPGPGPNPPYAQPQNRARSDPSFQGGLRKPPSSRSLRPQDDMLSTVSAPPMPAYPGGLPPPNRPFGQRNGSTPSLYSLPSQLNGPPQPTLLPSEQLKMAKAQAQVAAQYDEPSPPTSPVVEAAQPLGPTTTSITAQMKCKVFLQQHHSQWKSLGTAKLKLYRESPTNVKQLVVEAEDKKNSVLISTIVLADGVERVGKTGVAVEISDRGRRSGVIYMLQLRNENSAGGLFDSLLAGSDRSVGRT